MKGVRRKGGHGRPCGLQSRLRKKLPVLRPRPGMRIHIFELRSQRHCRKLLKADGWRLHDEGTTSFSAVHPHVKDQPTARTRLQQLGLLTSSHLRIEFDVGMNYLVRNVSRLVPAVSLSFIGPQESHVRRVAVEN